MMSDAAASKRKLKCDLLLLVTTSSELKQLRQASRELEIPFEKTRVGELQFFWMGAIGVTRVNAVRTREMGPFSFGGSAATAIYCRTAMSATGLVQLGMAFGVSDRMQSIGDVLVSTWLYPYDRRDVVGLTPERACESCGRDYRIDYSQVQPHAAKSSLLNQFRQYAANRRDSSYGVLFGGMLSGGARIRSRSFLQEVVSGIPSVESGSVIGGDMEGIGLLSVSRRDDPSWIVVKGICDFADENRDSVIEEARPVACHNSASFVLSALQDTNLRITEGGSNG